MKRGPYRDGKVHVLAEQCKTCIFRSGNLMHLGRGRVHEMVTESIDNQSAISCHEVMDTDPAICRGFYDLHGARVFRIRLAKHLDMLVEDPPPG